MRPPHYTGEDGGIGRDDGRQRAASMRPPHYTGEDDRHRPARLADAWASMRPPHYTGEDVAQYFFWTSPL